MTFHHMGRFMLIAFPISYLIPSHPWDGCHHLVKKLKLRLIRAVEYSVYSSQLLPEATAKLTPLPSHLATAGWEWGRCSVHTLHTCSVLSPLLIQVNGCLLLKEKTRNTDTVQSFDVFNFISQHEQ